MRIRVASRRAVEAKRAAGASWASFGVAASVAALPRMAIRGGRLLDEASLAMADDRARRLAYRRAAHGPGYLDTIHAGAAGGWHCAFSAARSRPGSGETLVEFARRAFGAGAGVLRKVGDGEWAVIAIDAAA